MRKRTLWYVFLVLLCCGALALIVNATANQNSKPLSTAKITAPTKSSAVNPATQGAAVVLTTPNKPVPVTDAQLLEEQKIAAEQAGGSVETPAVVDPGAPSPYNDEAISFQFAKESLEMEMEPVIEEAAVEAVEEPVIEEEVIKTDVVVVPPSGRSLDDACPGTAIADGPYPLTLTTQTNCGLGNTYSATCLGNYDGGEDKVYNWTIAAAGYYIVTLNPYTTTYSGVLLDNNCPPDASGCITYHTNAGSGAHSTSPAYLTPGTYYIMVDTWPSPTCIPSFDLTLSVFVPPAGDNCGNAIAISDAVTLTAQSTAGMSDDYNATCLGSYDAGWDIVYAWTVTTDGYYNMTLNPGATTSTGFLVDDNCPPDASGCVTYRYNTAASAYQTGCRFYTAGTYYIMVDRLTTATAFTFDLTIAGCTVPDGDVCADPIDLDESAYPINLTAQTTVGMANNYNNTCLGTYDEGADIVYEWTVGTAGTYLITMTPGVTYTGILIDDNCPPDVTGCIAYATNSGSTAYTIPCNVYTAGTYYIMVDRSLSGGFDIPSFTLNIATCTLLPGEICYNAVPITDAVSLPTETTVGYANNYGASSLVMGTSRYDAGLDKVYLWTVTTAGDYTITLNPGTNASTGFLVDDSCPTDATGLYWRCSSTAVPYSLCRYFDVGEYYIMVDRYTPAATGFAYSLTITTDACVWICPDYTINAVAGGSTVSQSGTTVGAGDDCSIRAGAEHIIAVNIPSAGLWSFQMCGVTPTWDTYLYLTTLCGGGTILAYNDDGCGGVGFSKILCANIPAAGTYYCDVEPYGSTTTGAYTLSVSECVPCPDIVCTPTLEEGAAANGGCSVSPTEALVTMVCGDIAHGTITATLELRDIDAFEFILNTPQVVTLFVVPEFDAQLEIRTATGAGLCPDNYLTGTIDENLPCVAEAYVSIMPAGVYHVYVTAPFTDTQGAQNYCLHLECIDPPIGRCCYGPLGAPLCTDTGNEIDCDVLGGLFTVGLNCDDDPCEPAPDDCETADALGTLPASVQANCALADDDVAPVCTSDMGNQLWYTVVGDGTTYTATTCNAFTDFDTEIQVFLGPCETLVCVIGNDDDATCTAYSTLRSRVEWCTEIGVTYYIACGGYYTGSAGGNFQLDVTSDGEPCSAPRLCADCEPEDVVLDPVPAAYGVNLVNGDCDNGGKWVGEFTGVAGYEYHFDLCVDAPGAGTGSSDLDVKVLDASCTILTGVDGSCSGPSTYLPNDFTWTCPAAGTYYVIIAPYYSYTSHTCTGDATDTFTLDYYGAPWVQPCADITCTPTVEEVEPNLGCLDANEDFNVVACGDVVHGTITASTTLRDVDFYVLTLATPQIVTITVDPEFIAGIWLGRTDGLVTCPDIGVAGVVSPTICEDVVLVSACLPAGEYHIEIYPEFASYPVPQDYCMTIACEPCVVPTGRCCSGDPFDPTCADGVTEFSCDDLGGTWTEGLNCNDDPCPTPPGCSAEAMEGQRPHLDNEAWEFATSELNPGYTVYDNFFSANLPINGLTFWGVALWFDGAAWNACTEDPMAFEIKFYADAAGYPDVANPVCTYTVSLNGVADGELFAGLYQQYKWTTPLVPACTINPGWVSIQGQGATDCWFLWSSSPEGTGASWQWDGTAYTANDWGRAFCFDGQPCDPVEDVDVYLVPGNANAWLHFTAPQAGDYDVYSSVVPNNDGDPRASDPDFVLETTLTATTDNEAMVWTDPAAFVAYKNYVVVQNCGGVTLLGRCCYGALEQTCEADVTLDYCNGLSGTWTYLGTCPCPVPSYCAASYSNITDDWITNVTFNTINNTTGQEGAGSYGDYTAISTIVTQGVPYVLSVTFYSGTYTEYVSAWFDWDGDYEFEASERFDLGSGIDATLTASIPVPLDAVIGSTRLRVIEQWNSYPTNACPAGSYGEIEDYTINVVAP